MLSVWMKPLNRDKFATSCDSLVTVKLWWGGGEEYRPQTIMYH